MVRLLEIAEGISKLGAVWTQRKSNENSFPTNCIGSLESIPFPVVETDPVTA